jgi:hypothetical protein
MPHRQSSWQEILKDMPFTLSHAAAAWPFRQTRLDFSALLVGCFVPDFPYFLFLKAHGFQGHTLSGMFTFDLPAGLIALWLFHSYVKQPALVLLPDGFRRRLRVCAYSFLPPARLALIAISVLIGSATHILWDAFTHRAYWPYRHWSFLRMPLAVPILEHTVMYKMLQYISSVVGLALVAIWVWHWYRTTEPVDHPITQTYTVAQRFLITIILPAIAICYAFFRAHEAIRKLDGIRAVANFSADALVTAIAIFGLGLLVFGVVLRRREAAGEVS